MDKGAQRIAIVRWMDGWMYICAYMSLALGLLTIKENSAMGFAS